MRMHIDKLLVITNLVQMLKEFQEFHIFSAKIQEERDQKFASRKNTQTNPTNVNVATEEKRSPR